MKKVRSKIYNIYIPNSQKIKNKLKLNPFKNNKVRLAMIIRQMHLNSEKINLKSTKDDYQFILESFKKLVDQIGIKTPLGVSMLYTYLVRKGYFSKNISFKFDEDRVFLYKALPYSVINGSGVCLNISTLLVDCLHICGYNAAVIANYSGGIKNNYMLDVKMQKQKYESKNQPINNVISKYKELSNEIFGNHAFVMIEENNNYYIYDPTSSTVKTLISLYKCRGIAGEGINKLKLFHSYSVNLDDKSINTLNKYIHSKNKTSIVNPLNVIVSGENMINFCNKNEDLFKEFYNEIEPHIEKISDFIYDLPENACKTK